MIITAMSDTGGGSSSSAEESAGEFDEGEIEMLATSREKRFNAGAKMAQLLEGEEAVDEFYMSAYGGFNEEEEDDIYKSSSSESEREESDATDSDFDIDEREESGSDKEGGEDTPRRQRKPRFVTTKAYKEPSSSTVEPRKKRPRRDLRLVDASRLLIERKPRASTTLQTQQIRKRKEQRHRVKRRKHHPKLSQEELLEEAAETEKLNLMSLVLEKYQQFELEMKSKRNRMFKRKGIQGEKISYLSLTVLPSTSATSDPSHNINGEVPASESESSRAVAPYSRNFMVFADSYAIEQRFPAPKTDAKLPRKEFCVVTGEPAKYRDTVTGLPYSNSQAFKKLREAYEAHVEANGNKKDPAVAEWLRWRHLTKS